MFHHIRIPTEYSRLWNMKQVTTLWTVQKVSQRRVY
jgi:hypothetical protein